MTWETVAYQRLAHCDDCCQELLLLMSYSILSCGDNTGFLIVYWEFSLLRLIPLSILMATKVSWGLPWRLMTVPLATWPKEPCPIIFSIVTFSRGISKERVDRFKGAYWPSSEASFVNWLSARSVERRAASRAIYWTGDETSDILSLEDMWPDWKSFISIAG